MISSFPFKNSKLNIPLSIVNYINNAGIRRPFACYIGLKFQFSGKVHKTTLFDKSTRWTMGIKDKRSFNAYIDKLVKHQFLVFNPKSGYYFFRSFDRLRTIIKAKDRASIILYCEDFSKINSLIDTALIGQVIRNQEYFWVKGKKNFRRAAFTMKDNANTLVKVDETKKPPYFGLSNFTIAKYLNCSLSQACKRKHKAEQLGLLLTKKHFKLYTTLSKADYNIREQIYRTSPTLGNRLRFTVWSDPITGKKGVSLVQQLHDEITPLTQFSKRKRILLK